MKKILLAISVMVLMSCGNNENRVYTLEYVVFYPNFNDTIKIRNNEGYFWSCDRGNNYIKVGSITGPTKYSGSAPYKILSYTYKDLN